MARPSILLRWANAVTGSFPGRTEPNDGKKDVGFDDDEAPPAGEHNWLFGLAGDWITYLDGQATRLLSAAILTAVNVFARTLFVDNVDNEEALLSTTKLPQDSVTGGVAYPSNTYKLLIDIPIDSGHCHLRFYVGKATDGSSPSLVITFNAYWSTNTNNWYADHSAGQPATALIVYPSSVEFHQHPVPAPTNWTSWPDHGDVLAGGDVTARGGVTAFGDVTAHGAFQFAPVKLRTSIVNLADCSGDVVRNSDGSISVTASGKAAIKVRLPKNATYGDIQIMHSQVTADGNLFGLVTRRAANWTTPTGPTVATPVTVAGPASIVAARVDTLSTSGLSFDTGVDEVEIVWQLGNPTATANKILQIRMVNWQDNGPYNDV